MNRNYDLINISFPEFACRAGREIKEREDEVKNVSSTSEVDALLDVIYQADPKSKWPTGDYAMLMSDKCSPEIREFIKANLLGVISDAEFTKDVSDDVLMELTRGKHETISEYVGRMTQYAEQNKLLLHKQIAAEQKSKDKD